MVRYKLYNPNAQKEEPKDSYNINNARKYAMRILKEDWSVGYLIVLRLDPHSAQTTPVGFVCRNVKNYYQPEKILKFDYIVENPNRSTARRHVYDIAEDGSITRRL